MFFSRSSRVADSVPSPDQARELVLYKYDACSYCRTVLRRIAHHDLSVELRDVLMQPAHRRALADATGRTQVPCLFIDGVPLFESYDIVAWLDAYATRQRS